MKYIVKDTCTNMFLNCAGMLCKEFTGATLFNTATKARKFAQNQCLRNFKVIADYGHEDEKIVYYQWEA